MEDPDQFAKQLQEEIIGESKPRQLCMRAKRCSRNLTCEHAQVRNKAANVVDLFRGQQTNGYADCANWLARDELRTEGDIFRKKRPDGTKHNLHASREAERKELLRKIDAGEPIPFSNHTPEELKNMLDASRRKKVK